MNLKRKHIAVNIIRKRYIIAIYIIAALVIASHFIVEYANKKAEFDSRIINIAGRQRMLSQKITKCTLGIYLSETKTEREKYAVEVTEALELWKKSHNGLKNGDKELEIPKKNTPIVSELFDSIEETFETILKNSEEILMITASEKYSDKEVLKRIEKIRENEILFLPIMDKIVFQYDAEAKQKIKLNERLNILLGLLILFTLVMETLFIFRPLEEEVVVAFDKMLDNEENLQRLFDVAPQIMFLVSPEKYQILRLNQKASEALKMNFDEVIDKNITEFIEKKHIERIEIMNKKKFNGQIDNIEVKLKNKNNIENHMLMSVSRLYYHQEASYLIGLTNIEKQKEQESELSYYATIDGLTGLINRRAGLIFLEKEFDSAKRKQLDLTIAFIDIDGLKFVNDTFGHNNGDLLIKNIASAIQKVIRNGDIAFRYGGDEIVLILKYCKKDIAEIIMSRLIIDLEMMNKTEKNPFKYEISYGIAEFEQGKFKDEDEFVNCADKIMYERKIEKKKKRSEEQK